MKRITWFAALASLTLACSGLAAGQCAGQQQFGGFDLLQTSGGTQDDLSSAGFGLDTNPPTPVSFSGVPLPHPEVGTSDTIVCRLNSLPNPLASPTPVPIQIVALYLKADTTYTRDPQNVPPTPVTVYATINQTFDANGNYAICPDTMHPGCTDNSQVLPQLDALPTPSSGQMTVFPNTFDTNSLNIQADLIVVPQGGLVTDTPLTHLLMPLDTIMSSGSTWTTTPPAGYPNSMTFPPGGFFVNQPGAIGPVVPVIASRVFRVSLYGLALLLCGIAVMKIRSGVKNDRLTLRPVYLMGLAAIAWFLGWRSTKLLFPPTIAHAYGAITTCAPQTVSAFVQEGGTTVVHKIVTAVCTTISTTTSFGLHVGLH